MEVWHVPQGREPRADPETESAAEQRNVWVHLVDLSTYNIRRRSKNITILAGENDTLMCIFCAGVNYKSKLNLLS